MIVDRQPLLDQDTPSALHQQVLKSVCFQALHSFMETGVEVTKGFHLQAELFWLTRASSHDPSHQDYVLVTSHRFTKKPQSTIQGGTSLQ